ncbi:MAG: methyltransferase [Planctomycetes bacterium]|nr:methyltransferase [Planctomycetota bacterium]
MLRIWNNRFFACDNAKHVTATDINPISVDNIVLNAKINALEYKLTAIKTDLFPSDTSSKYDVIIINPPYTNHPTKDIVEKSVWDKNHSTIK